MARWQRGLAVGAALVAGAALGFTAYLTVVRVLDAASPAATPSPTASSTPTATPTGDGACDWANLPEDAKPPLAAQAEGLPEARLLTDAVWDCVDDTWVVETRRVETDGAPIGGTAQALYLSPPEGDLVLLYELRTDVQVEVVALDLAARLAWTARLTGGDGFQVVQIELEDGLVVEDWGAGAVPPLQRWGDEGQVSSVAPVRDLADGTVLWAGYSYRSTVQSLFLYVGDGEFRALAAQRAIGGLLTGGGVDSHGDVGAEVWLDDDGTVAVMLIQRAAGSEFLASAGGTWVVIDLTTDQWRLVEATSLPGGLCGPAEEARVTGTAQSPGALAAVCWTGPESQEPVELVVE